MRFVRFSHANLPCKQVAGSLWVCLSCAHITAQERVGFCRCKLGEVLIKVECFYVELFQCCQLRSVDFELRF